MHVERNITRRISLTAAEIYDALVRVHGLPPLEKGSACLSSVKAMSEHISISDDGDAVLTMLVTDASSLVA